jgi:hypothetical protein
MTTTRTPEDEINAAIVRMSGGLDFDDIAASVESTGEALRKIAKELAGRDLTDADLICPKCQKQFGKKGVKTEDLPRMLAYGAKQVDDLTRLLQLISGNPDSRPDGTDWLRHLTDAQFQQVKTWVAEKQAGEASHEPDTVQRVRKPAVQPE